MGFDKLLATDRGGIENLQQHHQLVGSYAEKPGDIDDRALPRGQIQFVRELVSVGSNVIVVLVGGRLRLLDGLPSVVPNHGECTAARVSLNVTNTGSRAGNETVVLFVSQPYHRISITERKQLKKFEEIELESRLVHFTLSAKDWSVYRSTDRRGLSHVRRTGGLCRGDQTWDGLQRVQRESDHPEPTVCHVHPAARVLAGEVGTCLSEPIATRFYSNAIMKGRDVDIVCNVVCLRAVSRTIFSSVV